MIFIECGEIMNYTVFDVETANNNRDSICSIGIVRVENDDIVFEKEYLINPECDFNFFNIKVHGITPEMVMEKSNFPVIWNEIKEYFDGQVLVAHNAKSMDLCALFRTLERYELPLISVDYICTLELAKRINVKENCTSLKLNDLCDKYNILLKSHHNALDDSKACYGLLCYYLKYYEEYVKPQHYTYLNKKSCNCSENFSLFSDKTIAMQELQKIVISIIEDGVISEQEANNLLFWMNNHNELKGYYPFGKIFETIENILIDCVIDKNEEDILINILDSFINPKTQDDSISINGKFICLSGDFAYGSKKEVEAYLLSKGAEVVSSVTKKTDILVLGQGGSAMWKYGNYGSKYEKVQKLNENGCSILVYKENDFLNDFGVQEMKEQIDIEDELNELCIRLTEKYQLSPNYIRKDSSLSKAEKNKGETVSIFIQIFERNYPEDKHNPGTATTVLRISANNPTEMFVSSKNLLNYIITLQSNNFVIKENRNKDGIFQNAIIRFNNVDEQYYKFIDNCVGFSLENYISSSAKFGCCAKYNECKIEGRCLHQNKLYATVCEYKKYIAK